MSVAPFPPRAKRFFFFFLSPFQSRFRLCPCRSPAKVKRPCPFLGFRVYKESRVPLRFVLFFFIFLISSPLYPSFTFCFTSFALSVVFLIALCHFLFLYKPFFLFPFCIYPYIHLYSLHASIRSSLFLKPKHLFLHTSSRLLHQPFITLHSQQSARISFLLHTFLYLLLLCPPTDKHTFILFTSLPSPLSPLPSHNSSIHINGRHVYINNHIPL